jgi:co-chaperonin GroES (HSP10)
VEKIKPSPKTAGGIVLPENVQEKSNLAKVIAVGKGNVHGFLDS